MVEIEVDFSEVNAWVNNQPNRTIARGVSMVMMKNKLVEMIKKAISAHSVSGELENSIIGESSPDEIKIYSKMYGDIVLEFGRRPGKMPPVEALERFAEQRLGDKQLAFLVARSIAKKGTKKYQTGSPKELSDVVDDFENNFVDKELGKLLEKYAQ